MSAATDYSFMLRILREQWRERKFHVASAIAQRDGWGRARASRSAIQQTITSLRYLRGGR